jgi:hypothetical protein
MCGKTLRDREFDSEVFDDAPVGTPEDGPVENDAIRGETGLGAPPSDETTRPLDETTYTQSRYAQSRAAAGGESSQTQAYQDGAKAAQETVSAFDRAAAAYNAIKHAQLDEETGGPVVSEKQKVELVAAVIEPFYQGGGNVDHMGLLDALESFKGSRLSIAELQNLGRVVGVYCAERAHVELQTAKQNGDFASVSAILRNILGE